MVKSLKSGSWNTLYVPAHHTVGVKLAMSSLAVILVLLTTRTV